MISLRVCLPPRAEGEEGGRDRRLRLGRLVVKGQPRAVQFTPPALLVESLESNARSSVHSLLHHRFRAAPLPLLSSQLRDGAGAGGGVVVEIAVERRAAVVALTLETRHSAPALQLAEVALDVCQRGGKGEGGKERALEVLGSTTYRLPLVAGGSTLVLPLVEPMRGGVVCVRMLRCYSGAHCTPAVANYTKVQLVGCSPDRIPPPLPMA